MLYLNEPIDKLDDRYGPLVHNSLLVHVKSSPSEISKYLTNKRDGMKLCSAVGESNTITREMINQTNKQQTWQKDAGWGVVTVCGGVDCLE